MKALLLPSLCAITLSAFAESAAWFDAGIAGYESWPADGSDKVVENQGTWSGTDHATLDTARHALQVDAADGGTLAFAPAAARDAASELVERVVFVSTNTLAAVQPVARLAPLEQAVKAAIAAAADGAATNFYGWAKDPAGATNVWRALAGATPAVGVATEVRVLFRTAASALQAQYQVDGAALTAGGESWLPVVAEDAVLAHAGMRGGNLEVAALYAFTEDAPPPGPVAFALAALPEHVTLASVTTNGAEVAGVEGVYTVLSNATVVVAFAADAGYRLVGPATVSVVMDGDKTLATADMPTAEPIPNYALTFPELPANVTLVSVTTNGVPVEAVEGVYTVPDGTAVVVTFAPANGYVLVGAATATLTIVGDMEFPAASIPTAIDPTAFLSINEIMASNPDPAKDANALVTLNGGVEMDWVELYNDADVDIDLSGWYLSDKPKKPTKSPIYGSCVVPAKGYKIVWLDDAYTNWAPTEAHADISLSASGEAVVLTKPDGTILQSIEFPQQIKGYSYGPGTVSYGPHQGEGPYVYMKTATPGAANVVEGWGDITPTVSFSVPHGYKTAAFDLELVCSNAPTATIYYTLDGSSPTVASTPYTEPLLITNTTVVRAAVPDEGSVLQVDASATYVFLDEVLAQEQTTTAPATAVGFPDSLAVKNHKMVYGMRQSIVNGDDRDRLLRGFTNTIATLSIVIDPENLFNSATGIYVNPSGHGVEWERQTMLEQFGPEEGGFADFSVPAGLRIRGGNSRKADHPKHALRLFFRSSYGMSSLKENMFPGEDEAGEYDKLDLRCSQNLSWANEGSSADTFIHEVFCRDSQRDMGVFYTRSRYYNLFINGQYWGVYQSQERGDEHFAEDYAGGDSLDWDVVKVTTESGKYVLEADEGTLDGWSNLWHIAVNEGFEGAHADNYNRILGLNPDGTRNPAYPVLLNATNLMVYALITHYVVDGDCPITPQSKHLNNMYCLRDRTDGPTSVNGFFFLRHDGEMSFGKRSNVGVTADPTGWGSGDPDTVDGFNKYDEYWNTFEGFSPVKLHWELEKNDVYKRACLDLFHREFVRPGGSMTTEKNIERFARRMAELDDAIVCEAARWGAGPNGTGDIGSRSVWLNACKSCTNGFLAARMPHMIAQYRNRGWYPEVEAPLAVDALGATHFAGDVIPAGEKVYLTGSGAGTNVYYTVDGTDPVALDGTVAASAVLYDAAAGISLSGTTPLKARAVSGGVSSALEEVTLVGVSAEYAPLADALRVSALYTSTTNGGDFAEFIVLTNLSAEASVDLSGARLVAWNAKKKSEASPSLTIAFGSLVIGPGESFTLDQDTHFGGGKLTNSQVGLRLYDVADTLVQDCFVDADWWSGACDETGEWFVAKEFGTNATRRVQWRPTATSLPTTLRVAALYTSTLGDGDTGEFIVLTNLSSSVAIDLSDVRLVAWNAKKKSEADPSLVIANAFEGIVIPAGASVTLDQATYFGGGKLTNSKVGLRLYDPAGGLAQDVLVDAGWWDSACDGTGRWFVARTLAAESKTTDDWEPSPGGGAGIIAAVISVADAETGACTTNAVYASLAEAVAAASDGETVLLLADDDASFTAESLEIAIDKAITIDGDGHTLYGLDDYAGGSGDHDIYISGAGDITIRNITLANFGGAVPVTMRTYPIWTSSAYAGTLTLDNVAVESFNRTAFNLNGGTVVVKDCTIAGDLAKGFEGGVFQEGIGVYNANVTVENTTITGAGSTYEKEDSRIAACIQLGNPNGPAPGTGSVLVKSGAFAGEYGIIVASNALNAVTVQDGTFTGALLAEEGEGGTIVVDGGLFDAPVPAEFAGAGLVPTTIPDNDGMYTVRTARTVAFTVDGASYTNLVVADGEPVAQPADPAKADHVFAGWTLEGSAYDFSAPVTADIELAADFTSLAKVFYDPEGNEIMDPVVIEWLEDNGFEQDDIDALGDDSAATEEFYAAFINNYDFRVPGAGAALRFTDIAVGDDVSLTVQYVRTAPLGRIYGKLYFYGANDLAAGFGRSPIADTSVDFGETDATFATDPTEGTVTQTATATLSDVSEKFFKAQIHAELVDNGEGGEGGEGGGEEE